MIHLLYGDDTFSRQQALLSMKEQVGPDELRDVNVNVLSAPDVTMDELEAICSTVPFLSEQRLVVVEGLLAQFERREQPAGAASSSNGGLSKDWSRLPDYLDTVPPTTTLVFVDGRLRDNNSILRKLRAVARVETFPLPRGTQLSDWIRQRANAKEAEIEPRAVGTLAELVGNNLQVLDAELEKLASYCWGREIRDEDVRDLVAYAREANIFAAVDAALEGRAGLGIRLIRRLIDAGDSPAHVLSLLARQVRLLLLAKDLRASGLNGGELGRRLGLSGYPLQKTLEQEPSFSHQTLVDIHRLLLEADLSIKTGALDEEIALEVLVADISAAGRRR